jgi:hypothetical protein
MRHAALAVLLPPLLLLPASRPACAQGGAPFDRAIRASAALQLAARPALEPAAFQPAFVEDAAQQRRRRPKKKSTGVTLMIIGGSAMVVGAIAGDTGGGLLVIGGLVCAGYGFYLYAE